jgi:hypothetical protein
MRMSMVEVFIVTYENRRRRKSVEIDLRRREVGEGRTIKVINLTKIYCKHI